MTSATLLRGAATHKVLQEYADHYEMQMRSNGMVLEAFDILGCAQDAMPRDQYPGDKSTWIKEINSLISDVTFGASYLDSDPVVLATEDTFQYLYRGSATCPPFLLAAKVDAVLMHHDANGLPILEIVDWKGGANPRIDQYQELACRMVVQANAKRLFGIEAASFRSTTVCLATRTVRSKVISDAQGRQLWIEMLTIASSILYGKQWSPTPGPFCEWCPFFGGACSLSVVVEEEDEVAAWLAVTVNLG